MERRGEAISGSQGEAEFCWLENGRRLDYSNSSPCLLPQGVGHVCKMIFSSSLGGVCNYAYLQYFYFYLFF